MSLEKKEDSSYAESQEIESPGLEAETSNHSEEKKDSLHESEEIKENIEKIEENSQVNEVKNLFENEFEQKLYDEVLEKLDIKSNDLKQDIQEKSMQEKQKKEAYINNFQEKSQIKNLVERAIKQDFTKIQKLVKAGLINSGQGQNLRKQVLKKAFDKLVQTEKVKRSLQPALKNSESKNAINKNEAFEEFSKNNPDFFNFDGRKNVLDYLKSGDATIGKDELYKISDIIRTVEKAAIDRYLKKVAHEKTLRNSNEVAKQKLTANAQKTSFSDKNLSKTFTREQIGKMSSAEFAKYEPLIMEQLKKGLIK